MDIFAFVDTEDISKHTDAFGTKGACVMSTLI